MKVTLVMVDRRHLQGGFVLTEKPEVNWRNQTFTLVTFRLRVTSRFIINSDRSFCLGWQSWRRGSESNRRIKVLQTSPLPLGYRALYVRTPTLAMLPHYTDNGLPL